MRHWLVWGCSAFIFGCFGGITSAQNFGGGLDGLSQPVEGLGGGISLPGSSTTLPKELDPSWGIGVFGNTLPRDVIESPLTIEEKFGEIFGLQGTEAMAEEIIAEESNIQESAIVGLDLSDPASQATLRQMGAFWTFEAPQDVLSNYDPSAGLRPSWSGQPLAPEQNPLLGPDTWQNLRDLIPYLMPIGPDGNSPVQPRIGGQPHSGGPGRPILVSDPTGLDWTGGLGHAAACNVPDWIDEFIIGRQVNHARLSTVLLTSETRLALNATGNGTLYRYEACSNNAAVAPPAHCSAVVEADGRTVWTAHHCGVVARTPA